MALPMRLLQPLPSIIFFNLQLGPTTFSLSNEPYQAGRKGRLLSSSLCQTIIINLWKLGLALTERRKKDKNESQGATASQHPGTDPLVFSSENLSCLSHINIIFPKVRTGIEEETYLLETASVYSQD